MTTSTEPTRAFCYRCFKPARVCVCALLPQVGNHTPVHILQHPREKHRPIGTVRFAALGLQQCDVEVHAPWSGEPCRLPDRLPAGAAVLFPSAKARAVETLPVHERPTALVVLDGTWHQVNAVVRANPWLDDLPHVFLAAPAPTRYRIRAEPQIHYVSTLEAIVATLRALEPETRGFDELLRAFDAMIDTQVAYVGRGERRCKVPRAKRPPHLPDALTDLPDHHLLVHVDTVGARGAFRPIHVCAWRLATGERFECLASDDPASEAAKLRYLDLPAGAWAAAVPSSELHRRWQAFLQAGDVAVVWTQRAIQLLAMPANTVQLKATWCNLEHRHAGHLGDVLRQCGLRADPSPFLGELGRQMGELAALRRWVLQNAATALPPEAGGVAPRHSYP
ncbi:MAG: DTW domain-containing protein [Deltaproteobacteria bacterium]|nr:DTW domain-containing protein [Deltaproteobacteria bacterium]